MSEDIPARTPLEFLLSEANASPEALALRMNGVDVSYGELLKSVRRQAKFFRSCGVCARTKVAIYTDNDFEMVRSLFALWGIGAICVPMNITQKPDTLRQMEDMVKLDIGFDSADYVADFPHKFPVELLARDGETEGDLRRPSPEEIGMIMFTSGTSGVPKAVPMTHWAIGHNVWETSGCLRIKAEDKLLINTPPYTTSTIIHVLTMLARGASVVVERGFLFGTGILDQIREFNCTGFGGVPVHFSRLLAILNGAEIPARLRFLMNSGDHLSVTVIKRLRSLFPAVQIYCAYGLTEVGGRLCILDPEKLDDHMGSVGFPIKGMSVTVRDEGGIELPPNQEGEVYVEGPCLMSGYINNPVINTKVMTPHGFATGDFGYLNEEGYLFLCGRRDDLFKVGGEKVSTKMIEEAIFGFDEFEEFMVTPFYDQHMGNTPCCYYVLRKGRKLDRRRLLSHLNKILPSTHIPSRFVELSAIPRTSSGKVIRSGLAQNIPDIITT